MEPNIRTLVQKFDTFAKLSGGAKHPIEYTSISPVRLISRRAKWGAIKDQKLGMNICPLLRRQISRG